MKQKKTCGLSCIAAFAGVLPVFTSPSWAGSWSFETAADGKSQQGITAPTFEPIFNGNYVRTPGKYRFIIGTLPNGETSAILTEIDDELGIPGDQKGRTNEPTYNVGSVYVPWGYGPEEYDLKVGTGTANVNGEFWIRCMYYPSPGETEAPEELSLFIQRSAEATAEHHTSKSPTVDLKVDVGKDGFTLEGSDTNIFTNTIVKRKIGGKREIKTIKTSNYSPAWKDNHFEFYLPLGKLLAEVTATTENDSATYNPYNYVTVRALINAWAQEDTRKLRIESPTIEASYRRTTDNSKPIQKYRANKRPMDWPTCTTNSGGGLLNEDTESETRLVDSVAKWDAPSKTWMGQGIFNGVLTGYTTSQAVSREWSVNGGMLHGDAATSVAAGGASINLNPHSDVSYSLHGLSLGGDSEGSSMTKQSVINLTVKSDDDSTQSYDYAVNWHLPYEKIADLPNGPQYMEVLQDIGSAVDGGGEIQTAWVEPVSFDLEAMIDDVSVLADAGGLPGAALDEVSELFTVFKAIMRFSKLDYEQPGYYTELSKGTTWTPNTWYDIWADYQNGLTQLINFKGHKPSEFQYPAGHPNAGEWDMSKLSPAFVMTVKNVKLAHMESKLADQYDVNGWHSPDHELKMEKVEAVKLKAFFTYAPDTYQG